MSYGTESPVAILRHELERLRHDWWWFLLLGISLLVLGSLAIVVPFFASLATVTFFGLLLILGGGAQVVSSFWSGQWSGFLLHLLIGLLYVVVGVLMLRQPIAAMEALTLLMIAFFILTGVLNIVASLQIRFHNWGWSLLNGFISLLLGILIWAQFPAIAIWVLGLFLGIEMIFNGWAWIMLSIGLRSLPRVKVGA